MIFIGEADIFALVKPLFKDIRVLHCDKELTSSLAQTWLTKTVNHHGTYPNLFAGSHLFTAQKPASERYVTE